MTLIPFSRAAVRGPVSRCTRPALASLLATSLLALSACGGGNSTSPPPPSPSTETAGLSPGGLLSRSGSLVLEEQDRTSAAGAQISQSSRFTLTSEGVTP